MAETQTEHQRALNRFKVSANIFAKQRERELEDVKFAAGEQWPDDIKAQRQGSAAIGTLPPTPARPCLEINKLRQPLQQIENQAKQARMALTFSPKGDGGSRDVADAYEDIVRAIQQDSRAQLARNWAFRRAVTAGLGWYRILYDYADDDSGDYDLIYKRILNQASVYPDPYAEEPDWSDGKYLFITQWMRLSEYKREYGESALAGVDDEEFGTLVDQYGEWAKTDGTPEGQRVQIAEYFYFDAPVKGSRKRPKLSWCKLNAMEVLEEQDWLGSYIPVIPVIGDEHNLNGERRWEGIVRPSRDACRSYLYMRSAQVESIGLAPRAPYVGYVETIEGYESLWEQANTRNYSLLPIKMVRDGSGSALPPPQRNVVEPAIQAITLAAHEADGDIKATTGMFDPSLGNLNPSDRSGKAILALQKQAETGTGGYLDNLANISMAYEGKVLRDLIPKIYDRPGRILAAIGEDDQRSQVMVNAPFIQRGGQPIPAPGNPNAKVIDLTKGEYSITPTVGKSHTTRREEGADAMGQLISAAPQLAPMVADLWVEDMDFPGARQIADRLKKMLPPPLQDNGDDPSTQVAQMQQQLMQATQVIQGLTAHVNDLSEQIKTKQVEAQAQLVVAQANNATKIEIAKIQAGAQLAVQDIKSQIDEAKVIAEQLRTMVDAASEAHQSQLDRAHGHLLSRQEHQQALAQAQYAGALALHQSQQEHQQALQQQAQAGQQASVQSAQDHSQTLQQQQQAADLAPEPTESGE